MTTKQCKSTATPLTAASLAQKCRNCKTTAETVRQIAPSIRRPYLDQLQDAATELRRIIDLSRTLVRARHLAARLPHDDAEIVMALCASTTAELQLVAFEALYPIEQFIIDNPADPVQNGEGGAA